MIWKEEWQPKNCKQKLLRKLKIKATKNTERITWIRKFPIKQEHWTNRAITYIYHSYYLIVDSRPWFCPCAPSCTFLKCLRTLYNVYRFDDSVSVGTKFIIKLQETTICCWNSTEPKNVFTIHKPTFFAETVSAFGKRKWTHWLNPHDP